MSPIKKTFHAGVLLLSFCTPALAQQSAPTSQEVQTSRTTEQDSDFRLFEPSGAEWEFFRSSGKISHESGQAVYNATCAGCHMPEGEGAVGAGMYPALADNQMLSEPSYPIYLILEGQKAMPPLGGMLDDQQVANVVNYIRSSFGNDFVEEFGEATAEDVEAVR